MKRIEVEAQPHSAVMPTPPAGASFGRITPTEEQFSSTLFAPLHYEQGYAYPLVVWLHSSGEDEKQLRRIMPFLSLRNYVGVAPGAPEDLAAAGAVDSEQTLASFALDSFAEEEQIEDVRLADQDYCWQDSPEGAADAIVRVQHCIQRAQSRFNIAGSRVFLAGEGAGGTLALRLAFQQPERFAGVLSFGGGLPCGHQPLGQVNRLRDLNLFFATARESESYPEAGLCQDLCLLHSAGIPVSVHLYPGEHSLCSQMLSDADRWMMQLVCGG